MNTKYARVLLKLLDMIYIKYPHVSVKLESYWGTESCHKYMKYLLTKDRDRDRKGICFGVYQDIITLCLLHISEFGNFDDPIILDHLNINLEELDKYYDSEIPASEISEEDVVPSIAPAK